MKYLLNSFLAICSVALFISCEKEVVNFDPIPIETSGTLSHKTENLIIVTLDGFRWQEVFRGVDLGIWENDKGIQKKIEQREADYLGKSEEESREKLMPFVWNTMAKKGQIYGNRDIDSKVKVKNTRANSFPGYHEIFTGYANPDVKENDFGQSQDYNIIEYFSGLEGFEGNKVGVVSHWSKMKQILRSDRNDFFIEAGSSGEKFKTYVQNETPSEVENSIEALSIRNKSAFERGLNLYKAAKGFVIREKPKVFYMSFILTDYYGHQNNYGSYLDAAHNVDKVVEDLWNTIQTIPQYKGKTTLFITVDHGRGEGEDWSKHGYFLAEHSEETWFAVMGPDTSPKGEMENNGEFYNAQFAKTFAALLGYSVKGITYMGEAIQNVLE